MSNTKFDKNIKIVIIGAGAAGLSAANALKQKGYQNIQILENSDRPGGKSNTILIDGRSYELGTTFFNSSYKSTFEFFLY
ncbi:MAG: FAD-dependent oxidoreductase [Xenococcus sp. MO_188.B8]|nr:FAD-dependent oxidoreductase [Xenococcus sp. MO_188.B8]